MSEVIKKQDISLVELVNVLLAGKFKILAGTLLFAIVSVAIALYLPNQYKSKSTLVINVESSGGLASLAGSLGGLAGMAGINLGGGQDNINPLIARELVTSQAFIIKFVNKHNMLVPLISATGWANNSLVIDADKYDVEKKQWVTDDESRKSKGPKQEDIVRKFKDVVQLAENSKTKVLTLSVEFYSPTLAQEWLTLLITEINETIRQYDIEESTKSIEYLKGLLAETDNSYFHETFYKLIEEKTKILMLSKVRDDYVFKTIDPPNLPEKKSKPLRAIICVVGTFSGGFFMTLWVLVRYFFKK